MSPDRTVRCAIEDPVLIANSLIHDRNRNGGSLPLSSDALDRKTNLGKARE